MTNETRYAIINVLLESQQSMTGKEIAKNIKSNKQIANYHLSSLLKLGIVLKEDNKYKLQPFFYSNTESFNEVFAVMKSLIDKINDSLTKSEHIVSTNNASAENTSLFLLLFIQELVYTKN